MTDLVERLIELEADIDYRNPPPPGQPDFRYTAGPVPVLLSAPHGAAHTRRGKVKEDDEYTAGMVRLLAELTGAHAIYAWRQSGWDPNFDPHAPYKLAMDEIVRQGKITFVLDFHGCSPDRDFGIALGSMRGWSCPAQLPVVLEILASSGFTPSSPGLSRLDLDHTFPGRGGDYRETITRFAVENLGVAALQVELNAHLRVPNQHPIDARETPIRGDNGWVQRTIAALEAVIRAIARMEDSERGLTGGSK